MARIAKRREKSDGRPVKIPADIASMMAVVAHRNYKSIAAYVDERFRAEVTRDYAQALKEMQADLVKVAKP